MLAELRERIIRNCRILVVDDVAVNRKILRAIYASCGFTLIEEAENGLEALELVESFKPNLILLDLMMPGIDGVEVCQRVHQMGLAHPPVIIVQSVLNDSEHKVKVFEAGGTDYITKPFDRHELIARTFTHLEKQELLIDMERHSERMRHELTEGVRLQSDIMPNAATLEKMREYYAADIAFHYQPSFDLGGDLWGIKPLSDTAVAIYMVDFSGQGMLSALNTFRLHTLMLEEYIPYNSPEACLAWLNVRLCGLLPKGHSASMLYVIYDTRDHMLTYASAGAQSPLIIKGGEGAFLSPTTGAALGLNKESRYIARCEMLQPGDFVLMHSDALVKIKSPEDTTLAEHDIVSAIAHAQGDAKTRLAELIKVFSSHTGYAPLDDDLTLILLSV